jgi:hypothetical protein
MMFLRCCAALCLAIFLLACSGGEPPRKEREWRLYAQSEDYQFYYDTKSIETGGGEMIKVEVKRTLKEEPQIINEMKKGIIRELKKRQKVGMSIRGFENFEHEIISCRIDCKSVLIRFLKSVSYDNRGNILETVVVPDAILKWEKIVPDTINDTLRRAVCKTQRQIE